jgi:very-short-patch-repair endonuclease
VLWRHGLLPERTQFDLVHRRTGWIGRLDFAWPSLRIAVETDGYATHRDRFRKDRRRWTD